MRMGKIRQKRKRTQHNSKARRSVLLANKLEDPLEPLSSFIRFEKNESKFDFECKRIINVDHATLEWILDLEKRNMKTLYDSCDWGWDFEKKRKEMTNKKAWYLVAKSSYGSNLGFSHFRFDMDYGHAVLYCYEIQLEETVRGMGLGKYVMSLLECIAFTNKMEKVVLTVFKHNMAAYKFFTALGYSFDVTSPKDDGEKKFCYVILSKQKTDSFFSYSQKNSD